MELWLQAPSRSGSDLGAARRGLASLLEAPSPSLRSCGSILCSARYHTRSREIARDDTTSFEITRDPLRYTQNHTQDITTHQVFALNNLLCAAMLLALVRFDARRTVGRAGAGAFAVGLALSNQHTAVFFGAPFALWALLAGRTALLRPAPLLLLAAAGLAGLSPYLYLVARGGESAAWGSWGETSTAPRSVFTHRRGPAAAAPLHTSGCGQVRGFLTHVLRLEYGTFRLANTPAGESTYEAANTHTRHPTSA